MSKLKNTILLESVITISSFLLSPFTGCQVYKLMPEIAVKQKLYQPFILCTSPHSCGKKSQESQKQLHQPHCILSSLYIFIHFHVYVFHLFRVLKFWHKYDFEYFHQGILVKGTGICIGQVFCKRLLSHGPDLQMS